MDELFIQEIAKALQESVPDIIDNEYTKRLEAVYSVYLNDQGWFDDRQTEYNTKITATRDISAFRCDETPERVYETETLDNPDFRSLCEDVYNQIMGN